MLHYRNVTLSKCYTVERGGGGGGGSYVLARELSPVSEK